MDMEGFEADLENMLEDETLKDPSGMRPFSPIVRV
jgi:hypothetical protein